MKNLETYKLICGIILISALVSAAVNSTRSFLFTNIENSETKNEIIILQRIPVTVNGVNKIDLVFENNQIEYMLRVEERIAKLSNGKITVEYNKRQKNVNITRIEAIYSDYILIAKHHDNLYELHLFRMPHVTATPVVKNHHFSSTSFK